RGMTPRVLIYYTCRPKVCDAKPEKGNWFVAHRRNETSLTRMLLADMRECTLPPRAMSGLLIVLREEIFIETLELNRPIEPNTNVMLNHQFGETLPINQNNSLREVLHKVEGLIAEAGSGDEYTLARAEAH